MKPGTKTKLTIFFASLILQVLAFNSKIQLYDEGIILVGAEKILNGDLPYKNAWTMYGPGQFYLVAWIFKIFCNQAILLKAIGLISKSIISTYSYAAIERNANQLAATIGAGIILITLISVDQNAFPIFPALALFLISLSLFHECIEKGKEHQFITIGLLTGLATCFRHDIGLYIVSSFYFAIINEEIISQSPLKISIKKALFFTIGNTIILLPVSIYFLTNVSLADLYENLIHIPSTIYPENRSLPFPSILELTTRNISIITLSDFSVYLPFFASIPAIILIYAFKQKQPKIHSSRPINTNRSYLTILTISSLLLSLKGIVRTSILHMAPAIVISIIIICITTSHLVKQKHCKTLFIALIPAHLLLSILIIYGIKDIAYEIKRNLTENNIVHLCNFPVLPRLRCLSLEEDYINSATFIKQNTAPGDLIYVGSARHDKLFVNSVALYYAAERLPATKWFELHPGVQTQERIQLEMIQEFTRNMPIYIITDSRWDSIAEPNKSKNSSGINSLDKYIEKNYTHDITFGTVRILSKRNEP